MALVTSKELLLDAQKRQYAVGAFNVENMEFVQAVMAAAEELHSPVIMQTTPGTLKYADPELFYANVAAAARDASVPVVLHLDHGNSFQTAVRCFHAGYTSIMIDGSKLPFEENIALTRSVTDVCHSAGIPVEAELGKVGGKEDDLVDVDTLAIAIGTAHGVYKVKPKLDIERITEVRKLVSIPLVLHGTSGVPDDAVRECVKRGMCKINYATDLRIAFSNGVKAYLKENPEAYDPKKYSTVGRDEIIKYVRGRMEVIGSVGKA